MKQFISLVLLSYLLISVLNGQGNTLNSASNIDILESELQREFDVLKTQTPPV